MMFKYLSRFNSEYKVSNEGDVISCKFNKEVKLAQSINSRGYPQVNIHLNGRRQSIAVHRLVAEAWLDDFNPDLQVNHIDGDKTNNHVSNLEMVTPSENTKHAIANGLIKSGFRRNFKFTDEEVDEIREEYKTTGKSQKQIAEDWGVSQTCISNIILNKNYKSRCSCTHSD